MIAVIAQFHTIQDYGEDTIMHIVGIILAPGDLISWLIVGLIAGFVASAIVRGKGFGCIGNIIVGLIGSVIGGYLASLFGFGGVYGFWGSLLVAVVGAVVFVWVLNLLTGGSKS